VYARLSQWHRRFGDSIEMLLYPSDEFGHQELPSEQVGPFVKSKGLPTDGGGCTLMAKAKVNQSVSQSINPQFGAPCTDGERGFPCG